MKTLMKTALLAAVLSSAAALGAPRPSPQDIVSLPNLSYRTGPFAATGIPLMNGQRDYMTMINERDGGVNGVKLDYEECETGYNTEKGVECYEKTKATAHRHAALVDRHHAAGAAEIERRQDADPGAGLRLLGHGRRQDLPMGLQPAGILLGRRVDDPAGTFRAAISTA